MSQRIYCNRNWKFTKGFAESMINEQISDFELVTIPHTIKEVPFHYFDEGLYQMIACYQKTVTAPYQWKGKVIKLTFEAVGHSCDIYLNGEVIAHSDCGYTAIEVDVSKALKYGEENLITVKVDSNETLNQPPFGYVIDYMTYGGIYRDVYFTVYEQVHFKDCFYKPIVLENISTYKKTPEQIADMKVQAILKTDCQVSDEIIIKSMDNNMFVKQYLNDDLLFSYPVSGLTENVEGTILATSSAPIEVKLWDIESPTLYTVKTQIFVGDELMDEHIASIGFRKSEFTNHGYMLNGRRVKLRGLNRHQSYPYVGYAMPESMQRFDAHILKEELGVNTTRTSHYPQSHYFYDECDKLGILVFTEMPGWQHIGDQAWQDVAVDNVKNMITQYRNHACIITWGVRINESFDNEEFYERTNALARTLDPTRPTSGVKANTDGSDLEDIYTYNDFIHAGAGTPGCHTKKQATSNIEKPYMVTEHNGHMFPTKSYDCEDKRTEHALRHANVIDAVGSHDDICGCIGWCMFDYNTHKDFGSGDRICYHGVMDMFRNPKSAAYIYAAEGRKDPVLFVSSAMDIGEKPGCNRGDIYILSNADSVKMYKNDELLKEYFPSDSTYTHMEHGPILIDDYVGDQLDKEGMSKGKTKLMKQLLSYVGRHGLGMTPKLAWMGARLIVFHHGNMEECTKLYNKYVGDWGGTSKAYRFEAIKDGKVVDTVVKEPAMRPALAVNVSHTLLTELHSYDVAEVRVNVVDGNGNVLSFYNEPLNIKVEGAVELIGPSNLGVQGGMIGFYVKSKGAAGSAKVTITGNDVSPVEINFNVDCMAEYEG